MAQIEIKLDDHGLANAFNRKAKQTVSEFNKFTKDLVDIAHRWVQNEAPRRTGKLKASVQKQHSGTTGYVFVSKSIAYYADWVIDGHRTRPFIKSSGAQRWVPGNPFVDKAAGAMNGDIERRVSTFEKWLESV